jgi:iron(III) transport system substrate-binding protein
MEFGIFGGKGSTGQKMPLVVLMLVYWFCAASSAGAQTKSVTDLANYRGADREEMLKAGAKKEGKLVWYTSLTAHRDIANVFEAKYPGIKVETYRAGPNDLTRRLITEAQSKRSIADLIETTPATLMMMRENKMLSPYFSQHLAQFPDDAKEEADRGRVFWTTDRESIVGLGYNRNLIRVADVPKNFTELAKPEYKGKIAVSGDTTGVRFIGAMIKAKGEEYIKQLRGLDIQMHMISGGAMHELMAAGEMPMSISIFRNHVLSGKPKGAPTEWVPMDLNPTNAGGVALPTAANNPYAALMFIDFLLSPEGQKIFEEKFRFATSTKNYGFKRWYPEKGYTLEQYEKAEDHWKKLLMELVRK